MVMPLELMTLQFVRSLREGNFQLYMQSLAKLVPRMFAWDRTNYSRWLPIHIRDMTQLEAMHPAVYEQFGQGHFTVQKTQHCFSSMALDQHHEQWN